MANKSLKGCCLSCVIREMQIKTVRYHYAPIRRAKIRSTDCTKCRHGCGAIGRNAKWCSCFGGSLVVSNKNEHTLTILSSNHTSWYLSKRCNNLDPHKNSHQDIYSIFIHDCQNLEVTKMSLNDK